jgi:hypothetical protein
MIGRIADVDVTGTIYPDTSRYPDIGRIVKARVVAGTIDATRSSHGSG